MKGDFSRLRFNRGKNYTSLLEQQGRVALDSDANEQRAIDEYIRAVETIDVIGKTGGPVNDEGFEISVNAAGNAIGIGKGRYYVEGILCENDHDVSYADQPFLIGAPDAKTVLNDLAASTINVIQVYLEVWRRLVTALDDPCLREPALGQADTTARLQTVWRVVLETQPLAGTVTLTTGQTSVTGTGTSFTTDLEEGQKVTFASDPTGTQYVIKSIDTDTSFTLTAPYAPATPTAPTTVSVVQGSGSCCQSMDSGPIPTPDPGSLKAKTTTSSDCGCQPIPAAGYFGLENQLYRVEIHHAGDESSATFKWSRENGSVVVAVTGMSGSSGVTVGTLPPDTNLGFKVGDWVEIYDDSYLLGPIPNQPGDLYQIQSITGSTVTMVPSVKAVDHTLNARMRRWDQSGASAGVNGVAVAAGALPLESGIEIEFRKGQYRSGDYWLIPARAAPGNIEWPPCGKTGDFQLPCYTEIFRAPLACIQLDSSKKIQPKDCRKKFYPLTDLSPSKTATCCTYRVGEGGDFKRIQEAIDKLPPEGGEVCILPGIYYENVHIENRSDVLIHGCGWQTRVASRSLDPNNRTVTRQGTPVNPPVNDIGAVFSIVDSHHIVLRSLAVEAADNEAGILIDGTETSLTSDRIAELERLEDRLRGVIDITVADLVIAAATFPAILADRVELLRVDRNRIAMKDVRSTWGSIYASGEEIHIEHNHLGIQSGWADKEWLPSIVESDLGGPSDKTRTSGSAAANAKLHQGGIQIGGTSTDVYILENEIDGGIGNGITLGSFDVLDTKGGRTGIWTGSFTIAGDSCGGSGSLLTSGDYSGTKGYFVVAGGILTNIQIHRNRIREMGLCGIGPAGYFDLTKTLEIISTVGLNITENAISSTLIGSVKAPEGFAYGAISLPDVQDLVICDNTITDFGENPGDVVCGIYILHGEMVEISRNRVIETRDWANGLDDKKGPLDPKRGGIFIDLVTPPALGQSLLSADELTRYGDDPVFEPGLPALRIENNVVRVPLCFALAVAGAGPFTISNNQFTCGGRVKDTARQLAQTVLIINFGTAIEIPTTSGGFISILRSAGAGKAAASALSALLSVSCGMVLFTGNECQFEARVSEQRAWTSVLILTLDHLIFSNNHCWFDASRYTALFDAVLLAGSLNVIGNRFQEKPGSVLFSGITAGVTNITGQNISTFCLLVLGALAMTNNNIALVDPTSTLCPGSGSAMLTAIGKL